MQKRSNPLAQPTPAEPIEEEKIIPAPTPDPVQAEPHVRMQKRTNPLSLEQPPAKKIPEATTVVPVMEKPHYIVGKSKKKLVITMLDKTLLITAQSVSGKAANQIIETALLQYLHAEQPKAYEAFLAAMKKNGCEIK